MKSLNEKKAIVLGGSRGIGAAIVKRLAQEGADVTFTYQSSKEMAEKLAKEIGAKAVQADSGNAKAVSSFIKSHGALDILVINAGIYFAKDALEQNPDDVDRMIDINLRGPYHAAVDGARQMKKGGRIIVIGSGIGDHVGFQGVAAYALTKSGLQGMVRGLARDFGPRGITVNNVQPGPVDTDMNPADGPNQEAMHSLLAIKRHARPDEIAGFVAYLVGPEAEMITGAQHTIDGGFTA